MKNKSFAIWISLFVGLAGCAIRDHTPVSTYTLNPAPAAVGQSEGSERNAASTLMLGQIRSSRAFSCEDIIYTDPQYGQNSYTYSCWSDSPTRMLLLILQEALEKSGQFKAVVPYSSLSQADLLLESTLFDLSHRINEDGTSDGIIKVHFNLVNIKTRKVIASQEIASSVQVATKNAEGAVAALNKAASLVTQDLIDWLGSL